MLDTTPITTAITRLISTGTTEEALLAAVAHLFPNLSPGRAQRGVAGRDHGGRAPSGQETLTCPKTPNWPCSTTPAASRWLPSIWKPAALTCTRVLD
jgi:hypothetical protein